MKKTSLNENFKPDDMTVISANEIFSEKQLREYTATYSVDERINPIEWVAGFFSGLLPSGGGDMDRDGGSASYQSALKPSVSVRLLEERTSLYVKGKLSPAQFAGTLKAAFAEKLPQVLPQILEGLPSDKASALKKAC